MRAGTVRLGPRQAPPRRAPPHRAPPHWVRPHRVFAGIALAMILCFAVALALWALDPRTLDGVSVWAKPMKFGLALAVHAGTLAFVASRMSPSPGSDLYMRGVAAAFLTACAIEMGWIALQAAQGQHSHFNDSTALHRAMFTVMAVGAVVITGAAAAVAAAAWRDPGFAARPVLRAGILLGFFGGTILTLVTAFAIGGRGSPFVGGVPPLSSRLMFTGWSLAQGDLRVAHFLATHMMQAVPIAALCATRMRMGRTARYAVAGFAALWAGWTLLEFDRALSGRPGILPLSLDGGIGALARLLSGGLSGS